MSARASSAALQRPFEARGAAARPSLAGGNEGFAARCELFGAPALMVAPNGSILVANQAATRLLASDGDATRTRIANVMRSGHFTASSGERAILVILENRERIAQSELRAAIARWRLTEREADVVALVAEGEANKTIAERLCIAPRTIEVHVASILRKAKVDCRARLIASFWTQK